MTKNILTLRSATRKATSKIEDVKPGRCNVHIEHNGFLEAEKHGRRYRDETLTLKPGQELKDLVFRMRPGALITGKIMDAEGDPILKASQTYLKFPN